jgi:hypothetical protein
MTPLRNLLAAFSLSALAACGGGDSTTIDANVPTAGVIGGTVTKGPMNNATVVAYGIGNGQVGTPIATATTDANGNFTMSVGSYTGPVMLQVSGGSYIDEARGVAISMSPGDVMTAVMPTIAAGAARSDIQVTPVTAMAQALASQMSGGMTDANIAAANAAMGRFFSVSDILHTRPMNPLVPGAGAGASPDARNYGLILAAMCQYAKDLNIANSTTIVSAMMGDAFDGVMDGRHGMAAIPLPIGGMMGGGMMASTAGTSGLAAAMGHFMTSPMNVSGMTPADMADWMHKLAESSGHI